MKKWLLLLGVLCLSACGFQLRGYGLNDTMLPFHQWAIDNGGIMHSALSRELKHRQNVILVDNKANAEAVLNILAVETDKKVQSINLEGATSEYVLTLLVTAEVEYQGMKVSEPLQVRVQRYMDYSDNRILGKDDEEARLWFDMRAEAAAQLLTRIAIIHTADMRARQ